MEKLTRESLRKIRENKSRDIESRIVNGSKAIITIGMGPTGVAAGARDVIKTLLDEIERRDLGNVIVRQSGFEWPYGVEPIAEVRVPGMDIIRYKKVDAAFAVRILEQNVIGKTPLAERVFADAYTPSAGKAPGAPTA